MVDQDPLPRWSFGRVTLLGDAAHPMLPRGSNGAGQAILDARALADCARSATADPAAALKAYDGPASRADGEVVLTNRTQPARRDPARGATSAPATSRSRASTTSISRDELARDLGGLQARRRLRPGGARSEGRRLRRAGPPAAIIGARSSRPPCRRGGTRRAFPMLCRGGGGYACGAGAATRAGTSRKGVMNLHEAPPNPAAYPVLAIDAKAEPTLKNPEAEAFYTEALRHLVELGVPFLLAGTYAVSAYTGISRATKDLDVFCKAGDYPRILSHFKDRGHAIEVEDERWIGKVYKGPHFFDVIFASSNGTMPVGDEWFENARQIEVFGTPVRIVGPTELVVVEMLHPAPPPLRRRRRRPHHPQGPRRTSIGGASSPTWRCIGRCCSCTS